MRALQSGCKAELIDVVVCYAPHSFQFNEYFKSCKIYEMILLFVMMEVERQLRRFLWKIAV